MFIIKRKMFLARNEATEQLFNLLIIFFVKLSSKEHSI